MNTENQNVTINMIFCKLLFSILLIFNFKVLQEYKETEETIHRLTEIITNVNSDENQRENRIKELHNKWFPKLCEIIENINDNFSKFMSSMSYAGEVQLLRENEVRIFITNYIKVRFFLLKK